MKLAALADIHGNVFALEAVIADAGNRGVDAMLNLGDSFYGPIAPRATFDLLMAHALVNIRGNQDRLIVEATAPTIEDNATLGFVIDDLGHGPLAWIRSLPFDRQFDDEIYLCHGTPANDTDYLLEDVSAGAARLREPEDILGRLRGQSSQVVLCGHSHLARIVELANGQLIVNPGSVGLPAYTDDAPVPHAMESHSHHASYAIIEKGARGWNVEQIRVAYDVQAAVAAAKQRLRNDWAHYLATGKKR